VCSVLASVCVVIAIACLCSQRVSPGLALSFVGLSAGSVAAALVVLFWGAALAVSSAPWLPVSAAFVFDAVSLVSACVLVTVAGAAEMVAVLAVVDEGCVTLDTLVLSVGVALGFSEGLPGWRVL